MTAENQPVEDLTDAAPPGSRVAVVTGASSGIGLAAAEELARRGWTLALVGRDQGRLAEALSRVRALGQAPAEAVCSDFTILDDVRRLAARLRGSYPRIDVLANNAGGTIRTRRSTVDGIEMTMQVNHLAAFLLSNELRGALRGGRIINTASVAHLQGRIDPDDLSGHRQRYLSLAFYGSAKQANILFAAEAARRWPDILSTSHHPGIVRTRFGTGNLMYSAFYRYAPFLRTPARGAETLVWLATTDAGEIRNGGYYTDRAERRPGPRAADPDLASRLWDASAAAVGITV
jgi:NAD(P)-dependent dehydrogenase (short-subunit alcohol dehydrogenase family)